MPTDRVPTDQAPAERVSASQELPTKGAYAHKGRPPPTCFNCGEVGHKQQDCRAPRRQNGPLTEHAHVRCVADGEDFETLLDYADGHYAGLQSEDEAEFSAHVNRACYSAGAPHHVPSSQNFRLSTGQRKGRRRRNE